MAGVEADQAEMIERMKAGGHILMILHTLAPGTGDPANFRIGDCSTQRNLDDRGRMQAKSIGNWLRSNGITIDIAVCKRRIADTRRDFQTPLLRLAHHHRQNRLQLLSG